MGKRRPPQCDIRTTTWDLLCTADAAFRVDSRVNACASHLAKAVRECTRSAAPVVMVRNLGASDG